MMSEFNKKEIELLNKMIDCYWEQNNNEHENNIEDWRTTFNIVEKLTLYNVSKRFTEEDMDNEYKRGVHYTIMNRPC